MCARLASQSKGGYYPTPLEEIQLVAKRLTAAAGELVNVLDVGAGRGYALKTLADHLKKGGATAISYGVEPETTRFQELSRVVNHALQDSLEGLRVSNSFGLLYCNPPYEDGLFERTEKTFFRELTKADKYLIPNAVVVLCVPQGVLKELSTLISNRLSQVRVYRFSDKNYAAFDQVVVMGYYTPNTGDGKQLKRYLELVAAEDPTIKPESIPTLDVADGAIYHVPVCPEVVKFRGNQLNPKELQRDLERSTAFDTMNEILYPSSLKKAELGRPILPLKPAHYGIAISAGAVGGNMGGHILKGLIKPVVDKETVRDESGEVTQQIYTKHHQTRVRVFHPTGVYDLE